MRSLRRLSLCAVAMVFLSSSLLLAQHVAPTVRITEPIDDSQLVTIKASVHPLANPQNDRGPASPSMQLDRLHLILKRSPDQETALRQLIQEQNTPGSPNYHKWLSPAQFAAKFGPSTQDISTVENWLSDQGFTINGLEPGNQTLDISGSVGQLQSTFHTQVHRYMVNGQLHYANADNPAIPAALAPVVGGFVSLNNFHYRSYAEKLGEAGYDPSTGRAKPSWTIDSISGENFVLSPADFAIQYDLPSTLKGDGQTIAIVNDSNVNIDLVNQFRTLFGLPANPPQVIIDGNDPGVDGINNPDGPNDDSVEAYLDVEWAGAVAPNATVDLVIAGDTSLESGLNLAAEHAVYSNIAPVVSVSFGLCELFEGSSNAFWNNLWEQASAQGQTVIVSTGDEGSAGCDDGAEYAVEGLAVNGLASTPYDVAVGGTDFFYSDWNQPNAIQAQLGTYWNTATSDTTPKVSINSSNAPIPEQPWNSSQYGLDLFNYYTANGASATTVAAGSGGASSAALCSGSYTGTFNSSNGFCSVKPTGYAKPAWQTGITGIPGDGVRDLPDVSLFASNGANYSYYPICATDGDCQPPSAGGTVQIYGVGGTSAAAPSFAGIMALVNQKYGRQGQADTILYPLKTQFSAAFHDVTNGNNSVPCAYSATANLDTPNCIAVTNPITIVDSNGNNVLEGQVGSGTTADYNAAAGYNLATGLGTVDAATLINDWGSVKLATSAVTFNATPTSITHGQSVTVSGAVTGTGTPTGNVAVMTDSTEPSQQGQAAFALDGSGNYSGSLSTLPGGSYNIWASYGGDAKNGTQVSSKVPIIVTPEASGVAFGLFANGANQYVTSSSQISGSIDYGTQLMLSARVAPSGDVSALQTCTTSCPAYTSPTGTVAFKDNSSTLNTAVINSEGDAEYNAPFSVGSHSVSASYNGDYSYNASTSSAITFTVVKDTPQLSGASSLLDASSNLYSGTGQPTVLTLLVENNAITSAAATGTASFPVPVLPPTGTITLSNSSLSALKGSFPLTAGVDPNTGAPAGIVTIVIPANTPSGTGYQVTVAYSGDSNYNAIAASSNTTFSLPIINFNGANGGLASSTIASVNSGATTPNTTVTISGTVTGQTGHAAPTGSVELYSSGYNLTSVNLIPASGDSSTFQFTVDSQNLLQGSNQVTIQYYGDNTYLPSAFALTTNISNPLSDFSMVPQSTIVPVAAGNTTGSSVTINLASINGFGGAVNLTCAASAGVSCALSPASATLSGGGSATTALTITAPSSSPSQNYGVLVTGKDAASGEFIHTLAITAAVSGSIAPAQTFTLSNSGAINVNAGVNSNNTSTITAAPLNGFTGTVNLSCAVTSGPSTNPITCGASNLSAASVNITGAASQAATLTITTSGTTTAGSYTVTVTGTSGGIIVITPVTVNVSMPSFTLPTNGSVSLTIASPGATTGNTAAVAVTPVNGFTGQVNLTCQVTSQPTGANDPVTCGVTSSVNITSASGQSGTLTISSTAATSAMNGHKNIFWSGAGGGMVLACALFFWIPKKRRSWLTMVVLLVFVGSMAGMGCGGGGKSGGGSSGGGGNPGTTAGNYIVTVTAKDAATGTITQTTTVNVTIQ